MRVNIKPLSINQAFKGQRFKTSEYKAYEKHVLLLLKPCRVPRGKLQLKITFGFSSKSADVDNPAKCFIDILQKKYRFNDKMIYDLHLKKVDVAKGSEFIDFEIMTLTD